MANFWDQALPEDLPPEISIPTPPSAPVPGPGTSTVPIETPGTPEVPEFTFPEYTGPQSLSFNIPGAPMFSAPRFRAPSVEDALNEPGYQFRLQEGERALQNSAAGRGILRTGGSLKDLLKYGQNFASQEYGNVFDRAARAYDFQYRAAKDEYSPRFLEWQTKSAASQRAQELNFQRAWDQYVFSNNLNYNIWSDILGAGAP